MLAGEHAGVVRGEALLDGQVTEGLVAAFARGFPGADQRAVVSMWTQWHFGMLIIPATAAVLVLDRDLPIDLAQVGVVPHEGGRTSGLVLADEGIPHEPGADRFSRLFDGHVDPLIRHFSTHFGVSPRLLWTNATAIFEWTLQQIAISGRGRAAALAEAQDLLDRQQDASGRRNPMLGAVRYPLLDGEPTRQRKLCCLRYLLPGVADCGSLCPLPEAGRCAGRPAAAANAQQTHS